MIPAGVDSGGHSPEAALRWCSRLCSPRAGKRTRCNSAEHRAKAVCPLLHAEQKITDNFIRGGSWCGRTGRVLKARKIMPKGLIAWAYHIQRLLLAHEIEPFSPLSAFPPQLGPQAAFSSVSKEESYCHLSKELIKKIKHTAIQTGVIHPGEALSFCVCVTTSPEGHDMKHICFDIYSQTMVTFIAKQYGYCFIVIDLQYSKAVFSGKRLLKVMDSKVFRQDFSKLEWTITEGGCSRALG